MDQATQIDREKIEANGWRQGAGCYLSNLSASYDPGASADTDSLVESAGAFAILVSHDCDIVNRDLAKEPKVEWLIARPIAVIDGSCLYAKNARKFHFEHAGARYEALAHERFSTRRNVLEEQIAEESLILPDQLRDQVADWLAKRYIRPAFPDTFNERTKGARKLAKEALNKAHEFFQRILIKVHPKKELLAGQPYEVFIIGVMEADEHRDQQKRIQCQQVMDSLEICLAECSDIEVKDSQLKSDDDVPISWLKYYVHWDFDYLTFRDEDRATEEISSTNR
jgi:hypothetical protein